ncbi:roadblock/LC7 domain-containing protein [Anaerolineales bacterium HSG24]|nr:roadblock/LC7 domain-containing protein [Anaerolineales bacterium HSG24]
MNNSNSGSTELSQLLATMNERGKFSISVLTDKHGFPIASAAQPGQDPYTKSAVVALVQKTASQASNQLGMAQTDEISMYDTEGRRLVCRPFSANGHDMILAVLVPTKHQSYRRLTNQAVSAICKSWKL